MSNITAENGPSPKSSKASFVLDADTFRKISPQTFYSKFLDQAGIRPDGRLMSDRRKLGISVGKRYNFLLFLILY